MGRTCWRDWVVTRREQVASEVGFQWPVDSWLQYSRTQNTLRLTFTTDTNAVAVGYFREFADAEEAVGNSTGAAKLRALATQIATAVDQQLWADASRGGDHYITQLNPDGSTRDLVDYDANFK